MSRSVRQWTRWGLLALVGLAGGRAITGGILAADATRPATAPAANPASQPARRMTPLRVVRFGTVLPLKFEGPLAGLSPTPVTLQLKDTPAREAADALAKAMGITFVVPPNYWRQSGIPNITLDLDQQPSLEALLQFCSQTGLRPNGTLADHMSFNMNSPGRTVGIWCVSGSFAFVLERLEHTATLGRTPQETFLSSWSILAEPKARVLRFPERLEIQQALDEAGHSLKPAAEVKTSRFSPSFLNGRSGLVTSITTPLAYPAGAGRRIAKLDGKASFVVETDGKIITATNIMDAAPETQKAGPMQIDVSKLAAVDNRYRITVTIHRGDVGEEEWESLCETFLWTRLFVWDDRDGAIQTYGQKGSRDGDAYKLEYYFSKFGQRVPQKLVVDVPTAVRTVTVPFYFEDLPLP